MNGYHFTSSLFDIEPGEDDEVNPRMYGRQLAVWLKDQLEARGYLVEPIIAEDWGRCLMCSREPFLLWVGCGSVTDYDEAKPGDPPPAKESITWHCFPNAEPPFWKRLFHRIDTRATLAQLDSDLLAILKAEARITIVEP
jgi:hypothetical protein